MPFLRGSIGACRKSLKIEIESETIFTEKSVSETFNCNEKLFMVVLASLVAMYSMYVHIGSCSCIYSNCIC